jgi:hypothetical protein
MGIVSLGFVDVDVFEQVACLLCGEEELEGGIQGRGLGCLQHLG